MENKIDDLPLLPPPSNAHKSVQIISTKQYTFA